jgi:hypothetical protein
MWPKWQGRTVAVLASGPSMSQEVADRVKGLPAIVVNNTFRLAPWADVLYAADAKWWAVTPGAMEFAGLKLSCEPVRGIQNLRNAGASGYSDEPDCVHTYGNSGAQAIQIAAKAGASRILLFGFDFRGSHWHGEHPKPLRNASQEILRQRAESMKVLAAELAKRSIEVRNCTPGSALTCFPRHEMEKSNA